MIKYKYIVDNSFDKRKKNFEYIKKKHPTKIPIILEPYNNKDFDFVQYKYLIPHDLTLMQFMYIVRKKIEINEEEPYLYFLAIINFFQIIN